MEGPAQPRKYGLTIARGEHTGKAYEYVWRPHPAQATILTSPHRFRIVPSGRRFGKTELASIQGLQWVQDSTPRRPVWWAAPTYDDCEPGMLACEEMWPEDWIQKTTTAPGNMRIETTWGGVLHFRSAEKERSLRGRGIRALIAEECGEMRETAWTQGLRPTLADSRAPALFIGTPKGRTWFWRLAQRGLNPQEWPDHKTFQYPTSANPIIHPDEVEAMRREMPDRAYRQEILAEFVDDAGGVFPNPRACVRGNMGPPNPNETYVAGWDPARHQDWSVLIIDRARDRHTQHFDRFQKVPYDQQVQRVLEACAKYKATLLMDATHGSIGDPMFEMAAKRGDTMGVKVFAFRFTQATKQNLINDLATHVGQRSTTWPDIPILTNEMEIYEWKEGGRSGAPDGWHDDTVIAKALAVWLAGRTSQTRGSEPLDLSQYY